MDKLLEYIKQVFDLFEELLASLGINVDWDALWGALGLSSGEAADDEA